MTKQFTLQCVRLTQYQLLSVSHFSIFSILLSIHHRPICLSKPTSLHNGFMIEGQFSFWHSAAHFILTVIPVMYTPTLSLFSMINHCQRHSHPLGKLVCENEDRVTSQVVFVGDRGTVKPLFGPAYRSHATLKLMQEFLRTRVPRRLLGCWSFE